MHTLVHIFYRKTLGIPIQNIFLVLLSQENKIFMDSSDYEIIKRTQSTKYRLKQKYEQPQINPERAIMVGIADMQFQLSPKIYEGLLAKLGKHPHFGYTQVSPKLPDIITSWFQQRYVPGIEIEYDNIVKSPNIIQFWHILVQTITKPGDNILFLTPTFNRFVMQAEHLGRSMLEVELETVNNRFEINFEALEECFQNNKITLFVFISPHNPCGRIWSREEVTRLKDIVLKHDAYFFCDEIYADFLEPKTEDGHVYDYFTSILQFEDIYPKLIYTTSNTKTFNCSGQGFGLTIIKNKELQKLLKNQLFMAGLFPTPVSIHLFETLYTLPEALEWRHETNAYLRNNFQVFRKGCLEKMPKLLVYDLQCSYLCLVDFKEYGLAGEELKKQFTSVDVCPQFMQGAFIKKKPRSMVRINLAINITLIEEMVNRMASMLSKQQKE